MKISASFRDATLSPTNFFTILTRLGNVADTVAENFPQTSKQKWCLTTDSREETLLYPAFDSHQPSKAALAVLHEEYRHSPDRSSVSLWDGNDEAFIKFGMICHIGKPGKLNSYSIEIFEDDARSDFSCIAAVAARSIQEFDPIYLAISPLEYYEQRVFDDRPGVGWMFYLPKIITARQVPEARALIPVFKPGDKKQTGTIIVSVIDVIFSANNPEHVAIANRIEIRLVDQDLLPRYADFR